MDHIHTSLSGALIRVAYLRSLNPNCDLVVLKYPPDAVFPCETFEVWHKERAKYSAGEIVA